MKIYFLIPFCISFSTIAMEPEKKSNSASNRDEEARAEHRQKHEEWKMTKAKLSEELYLDIKNYFTIHGYEEFLIGKITDYLKIYGALRADLLFYRGSLYRRLNYNDWAIEDFKNSISCSNFQNFSDVFTLVGWAKIEKERGKYYEAYNHLVRAMNSKFCTEQQKLQIENEIAKMKQGSQRK